MRTVMTAAALLLLLGAPAAAQNAAALKTGRLNQEGYRSELAGQWSPTTTVTYCEDRAAAEGYARERARLQGMGISGRPLSEMLGRTLKREGLGCTGGNARVRIVEGGEVLESAMRTEDGRPLYLVETDLRLPDGEERRVYALFSDWQITRE